MSSGVCPNPSPDFRELGLSGHVMKLVTVLRLLGSNRTSEVFRCIRCGQTETRVMVR